MTFHWRCDRIGVTDLLSGQAAPPRNEVSSVERFVPGSYRGSQLDLLWASDPTESFSLPRCIIVSDNELTDFIAWATTYFRHIRPFTAHCRVLGKTMAIQSVDAGKVEWPASYRSADIALIIAEAVAYSTGTLDISGTPFAYCSRTLSSSVAQLLRSYSTAANFDDSLVDRVKEGWASARQKAGHNELPLRAEDILDVWRSVISVSSTSNRRRKVDRLVTEALSSVAENGKILHREWRTLARDIDQDDSMWSALEGPREGRVLAIERALPRLSKGRKADRKTRAFLAGYLASRIQPGTLEHFRVLLPIQEELRESFLWYGVCAGLTPETTVDNFGDGLGWLLRRELSRKQDWLERPKSDISLIEYEVLNQTSDSRAPAFRTRSLTSLDIELIPFVSTNVRRGDRARENEPQTAIRGRQATLFPENEAQMHEVHQVLRRIEESSHSLNAIRIAVEKAFGQKSPKKSRKRK